MEKIIRDIVEADRDARERIESVKEERYNIQSLIKKQGEEIKKIYEEKTSLEIEKCKQELEEALAVQKKQNDEEYLSSKNSLKEKFDENKEHWVNTIYDRCLIQ